MQKFFNVRRTSHHTDVKQFDDVIYTPYSYDGPHASASSMFRNTENVPVADLLRAPDLPVHSDGTVVPSGDAVSTLDNTELTLRPRRRVKRRFDKVGGEHSATPEVFVFEFGVVVCWGMTEAQEKRFLSSMCLSLNHASVSCHSPVCHTVAVLKSRGSVCKTSNVGKKP